MLRTLLLITTESANAAREQVSHGLSPRKDYLELASRLDADLLDLSVVRSHTLAGILDRKIRRGMGLAWLASRAAEHYDVIFSDGEHIGLVLGILLARRQHRCRHVMIAHSISASKKRLLAAWARGGIDAVIVHSSTQLSFAINDLGFGADQVYLFPYQVDTEFWRPGPSHEELMIFSCGLECRDYPTLIEAVRGLPVGTTVGAMSHWSRHANRLQGSGLPPNVTVGQFNYIELKDLYSRARFVVVPLVDVNYHAGITTILEAMAMGKAVIVTRARGQQDTIIGPLWQSGQDSWPSNGPPPEASTGIYVPPGDVAALRSAIIFLLGRADLASVLGRNARQFVERHTTLEQFVQRLSSVISPAQLTWNRMQ